MTARFDWARSAALLLGLLALGGGGAAPASGAAAEWLPGTSACPTEQLAAAACDAAGTLLHRGTLQRPRS
ncbi:MAG: hypothetical protein WC809_07375 [Sinimarinibacterium sp.]|jgi:hypothetical protein